MLVFHFLTLTLLINLIQSPGCVFFLGYPPLSKGYIYLKASTGKVYISPHCIFHESVFPSLSSMDYVPSSP